MVANTERAVNWPEQFAGFRNAGIRSSLIYEGLLLSPHLLKIDFNFDPTLLLIAAVPGGLGIAVEFVSQKVRSIERFRKEQTTSRAQSPAVV